MRQVSLRFAEIASQRVSGARRPGRMFYSPEGLPSRWTAKKALQPEGHLLDITTDIQSLATFCRSSGDFIKHLRRSKRPMVLTVNGKAAAVVQDAAAYQRLLDIAARADAGEGIRQGLDDARKGRIRPARQFFAEFEAARIHPA